MMKSERNIGPYVSLLLIVGAIHAISTWEPLCFKREHKGTLKQLGVRIFQEPDRSFGDRDHMQSSAHNVVSFFHLCSRGRFISRAVTGTRR